MNKRLVLWYAFAVFHDCNYNTFGCAAAPDEQKSYSSSAAAPRNYMYVRTTTKVQYFVVGCKQVRESMVVCCCSCCQRRRPRRNSTSLSWGVSRWEMGHSTNFFNSTRTTVWKFKLGLKFNNLNPFWGWNSVSYPQNAIVLQNVVHLAKNTSHFRK